MLKVGTKVRITNPDSHYYGRDAWIEGDNQLAIAFAIDINSPYIPEYLYHYYVETPDGEDIEHGHCTPDGLVVLRAAGVDVPDFDGNL